MRRLLLAAALALGVHILLVGTRFNGLQKPELAASPRQPITLSLEAKAPTSRAPDEVTVQSPFLKSPLPSRETEQIGGETERLPDEERSPLREQPRHAEATRSLDRKPPRRDESAPRPTRVGANASRKTATGVVQQAKKRPSVPPPAVEKQPLDSSDVLEPSTHSTAVTGRESADSVLSVAALREATPLYNHHPPPKYPRIARRRGYEGTVILEVLVSSSGDVSNCRIHESSGHGVLDQAALRAVRMWMFEPGRQGNSKVDMWVQIPISFQLD